MLGGGEVGSCLSTVLKSRSRDRQTVKGKEAEAGGIRVSARRLSSCCCSRAGRRRKTEEKQSD